VTLATPTPLHVWHERFQKSNVTVRSPFHDRFHKRFGAFLFENCFAKKFLLKTKKNLETVDNVHGTFMKKFVQMFRNSERSVA
jgi:hypothetical protein